MKYLFLVILFLTQNSHASFIQGGMVKSKINVVVSALQSGIITHLANVQDSVKEGEMIVQTECERQKAHYKAAQSVVALKQKELDAKKTLFEQGVSGKSEIEIAKAHLDVAKSERNIKRQSKSECLIKSTTSGTVVERYITVGQYVGAGDPLLRVVDNSKLYIEFNAQASDFDLYSPGQKLIIKSNGLLLSGAIVMKRSEYINDNGTFLVMAEFLANEDVVIYAGMRVIIELVKKHE